MLLRSGNRGTAADTWRWGDDGGGNGGGGGSGGGRWLSVMAEAFRGGGAAVAFRWFKASSAVATCRRRERYNAFQQLRKISL